MLFDMPRGIGTFTAYRSTNFKCLGAGRVDSKYSNNLSHVNMLGGIWSSIFFFLGRCSRFPVFFFLKRSMLSWKTLEVLLGLMPLFFSRFWSWLLPSPKVFSASQSLLKLVSHITVFVTSSVFFSQTGFHSFCSSAESKICGQRLWPCHI